MSPPSHSQLERLAYLEMRVYFVGDLRRGDLENRFGIKPAAATRDLNAYRALAPGNLEYDTSAKTYVPAGGFQPVFGFSAERVLTWLRHGFGDGQGQCAQRTVPCEGASELVRPDFSVLAELTRAIHSGRPVKVSYLSLSSGASRRVIVPLALADNGLRWHLRAFDRSRGRFADFVLTRIAKATALPERAADQEQLAADVQWGRMLDLELVPHPGLAHPEAIHADYSMQHGVLKLTLRAALAGYALLRWGVDCSATHCLDAASHHLWLRNPGVLDGVESAALAPGYQQPGALA
jgi:predicted DNA-binding transcriptional regulator YafY